MAELTRGAENGAGGLLPAEATVPAVSLRRARRLGGLGVGFWVAVAWIAMVVLSAVLATVLPIDAPNQPDVINRLATPFHSGHLLGADTLGRDVLSRLIYGARASLIVSLGAVAIGLVVGGALGTVAGTFGGITSAVIMAGADILLAFPGLVLLLALVAFAGQSLLTVTVAIGFLSIPVYARVARANALGVAQRNYVLAARALGATHWRILRSEVVPNTILPVSAFGLLALGTVIVIEGSLAFLGLSVPPPTATWGNMISDSLPFLTTDSYLAIIPSAAMFLTVLAFNVAGDTLRRRLDVRGTQL